MTPSSSKPAGPESTAPKKEAVTSALQEYVRRRRQHEILDLVGQIPFDERYDHKPLRHRKRRP